MWDDPMNDIEAKDDDLREYAKHPITMDEACEWLDDMAEFNQSETEDE